MVVHASASMIDRIRKNAHTLLYVPLVENRVPGSMNEGYIPLPPRVPVRNVNVFSSVSRAALLISYICMVNMARALTLLSLGSLLGCAVSASNSSFDYDVLQYIDPLIGTANGGTYIFSRLRL